MMDLWTAHDMAYITSGTWHGKSPNLPLSAIEIDNRKMTDQALFIALPGSHTDGHDFVSCLSAMQTALVSTPDEKAEAAQLVVTDPLGALADLAKDAMARTSATKIAITGSVGKTGTKQAVAHILSCYGKTHASFGNFNNHIGAPLSMARAPSDATNIVMEMGMNHKGEISPLSHIFDGDIAIITKIAASHIGHFSDISEIAAAKAEIFDGMSSGIAILPRDDAFFAYLAGKAEEKGLSVISFGQDASADITLTSQRLLPDGQEIVITNHLNGEQHDITLGLSQPHHAQSALIITAILHHLDLDIRQALTAFANLKEAQGRGDKHILKLPCDSEAVLINDSYNAGPASMAAALSYVAQLSARHKALVLTDMLELGDLAPKAHHELLPLIHDIAPDTLILIGPEMAALQKFCDALPACHHTDSLDDILPDLPHLLAGSDLILVKGSNGSGAPQCASALLSYAMGAPQTSSDREGSYVS